MKSTEVFTFDKDFLSNATSPEYLGRLFFPDGSRRFKRSSIRWYRAGKSKGVSMSGFPSVKPKPEMPTQFEFELWHLAKVRKDIKFVNSILAQWVKPANATK